MTIRHLRIFIAVYQKESITEAAEELNMTQPTVTRAIQELEEHYSVRLFERIHRRLYRSEAGRKLYRQAVHVVSAVEQIEKEMAAGDENGLIRIGAGTTLGCILLPEVMAAYQQAHPQAPLHSFVTDRSRLQEMLMHNEIDFALMEGAPEDGTLKKIPIGRDRMVLILPRGHELCGRESIAVQDLASQKVVISTVGSASRDFLEQLFALHGMRLSPVVESESIPAIICAVRQGIGISLVPERLVSLYGSTEDIEVRELSYEVLTRENYLVWHDGRYLSRGFSDFIRVVKEQGARSLK